MSAGSACPAALLQQALDIYRQPLRYRRQWADPGRPLPEGVGALLDLAAAPPEALDEHARRLHSSREELSSAIGFFIRQILLAEESDPRRVLGLGPAATPAQAKAHYRKLMRLYHPDRGGVAWGGAYAPRINHAYGLLRAPQARPARAAPALPPGGGRRPPPPAPRRGPGLAASAAAAAAGLAFIAWNVLTLPGPAAWPPPPPPPAAPAPGGGGGLSERELQAGVLDRLADAYRRGDPDALAGLFSERAVFNRRAGREGIRREHAALFANTTQRELRLSNFSWQIDDQTAIGKGTFSLKLSSAEQSARPAQEGILILDVGREAGIPLIKGFFQAPPERP